MDEWRNVPNWLWLLDFQGHLRYLLGFTFTLVRPTFRSDIASRSLFSFAGASFVGSGQAFSSCEGPKRALSCRIGPSPRNERVTSCRFDILAPPSR
jgi:hypothetical protein